MPDIVATYTDATKYPQVTLRAVTEQGLMALAEAHGSKCTSITIAKRRFSTAKDFLAQRGCCVLVVSDTDSKLAPSN